MKKFLLGVLFILVLLTSYVFYIFSSTGFFREINNQEYGEVYKEIPIKGAEDFAICYEDSFMIISSTDRRAIKEGKPAAGGLYYLDLKNEDFQPVLISDSFEKPFHPHGISLWRSGYGEYRLFVINHANGRHTVEVYLLSGENLTHFQTIEDSLLISPNDLVAISENEFYLTNDHGKPSGLGRFLEDYLGLPKSTVVFYNGSSLSLAAEGISYANGINFNASTSKLYVASSRAFKILEYDVSNDRSISRTRDINVGSGVDNLEFDHNGRLYFAGHPNLMAFARYADLKSQYAPSELGRLELSGEPKVEILYINEGKEIPASSVAIPFANYLFIGTVMGDSFFILRRLED